jgi:hypothetical protein
MASALKALVKLTGCKPEDGEERQAYLERLVKAVLKAPEDDWATLPEADQDWTNEAVLAIKAKKAIVDPDAADEDEEEEAPKAKKPKKAKAADDEDEEEEDEEEAPKAKKPKKAKAADDEDEDEDEEEEAPKAKKPKKAKAADDEDEDEEEAPKAKKKGDTPFEKKAPGTGIVENLREAYLDAFLAAPDKSPKALTDKVLAKLEKKGIVPGKGTIGVQLAAIKSTLASLQKRGALKG